MKMWEWEVRVDGTGKFSLVENHWFQGITWGCRVSESKHLISICFTPFSSPILSPVPNRSLHFSLHLISGSLFMGWRQNLWSQVSVPASLTISRTVTVGYTELQSRPEHSPEDFISNPGNNLLQISPLHLFTCDPLLKALPLIISNNLDRFLNLSQLLLHLQRHNCLAWLRSF